jgi:hypothetical protein
MLLDNAVLQRGRRAHTAAKSNLVAHDPGSKGARPGSLAWSISRTYLETISCVDES